MLQSIHTAARNAAMTRAASVMGLQLFHVKAAQARHDKLRDLEHGRVLAMLGDVIFTKAGAHGSFPQQLYSRLWAAPTWDPAYDMLVEPVEVVLGRTHIKQAVGRAGDLAMMASAAGSGSVMQFLGSLVAGGALVGSGLGALNWHMKRDTVEDDDHNEELRARADFYHDTAQQINDEMRMRQLVPKPANGYHS